MVCEWCNLKNLFYCKWTQQEGKEDKNGLNLRSKTNLSLHLITNLSLFQWPITHDKLDVIGNNGNLVVMIFLNGWSFDLWRRIDTHCLINVLMIAKERP
jgi:hypothetical protein